MLYRIFLLSDAYYMGLVVNNKKLFKIKRLKRMETNDCLQNIWKIEQEILDVIHNICIKNNLKYSLAYGTLIGAVRHGGFIPWDDDIDIMMPREDYEKLIAIWDIEAPEGYILQNGRTDVDFTQNFTKIRKDHTTFLQDESEKNKKYHKGIFVDIFPGDRVASGKIARKLQYVACALNLLYSRGFTSGTSGVVGILERFLLKTSKKKYVERRDKCERFVRRWNGQLNSQYFFPSTIGCCREYYNSDLFANMKTILFNGREYLVVSDIDTTLRNCYGDYMKLPPEEERVWKHHPVLVNFYYNYEELIKKNPGEEK